MGPLVQPGHLNRILLQLLVTRALLLVARGYWKLLVAGASLLVTSEVHHHYACGSVESRCSVLAHTKHSGCDRREFLLLIIHPSPRWLALGAGCFGSFAALISWRSAVDVIHPVRVYFIIKGRPSRCNGGQEKLLSPQKI